MVYLSSCNQVPDGYGHRICIEWYEAVSWMVNFQSNFNVADSFTNQRAWIFLHKSAFHDALALWYGSQPSRLCLECVYGSDFSVEHALNFPHVGLTIQWHNELWDLTAQLLSEVCHDIVTEPDLQPLSGKSLQYQSAITTVEARLDIWALGFWGNRSGRAYFDVKVFQPLAKANRGKSLLTFFHKWSIPNGDPTIKVLGKWNWDLLHHLFC